MSVKRTTNRSVADTLSVALKDMGSKVLKVGWVSGKEYPDSDMTTAEVASIAEHGSPSHNIPPRPIIRPTMIREESNWKNLLLSESKRVLKGSQTAEGALNTLGNVASGNMRKTITNIHEPPIKRSTALARTRTYEETIKIPKGDPDAKAKRKQRKNQIKVQLGEATVWKPLVATKILLNSLTFSVESE